jgi:hypothetical protein
LASDPPTHHGGHRFLLWRRAGPLKKYRNGHLPGANSHL